MKAAALPIAAALLLSACAGDGDEAAVEAGDGAASIVAEGRSFATAPDAPDGPNDAATEQFDLLLALIRGGFVGAAEYQPFIDAGDARHAWLISDLMRFVRPGDAQDTLVDGFTTLTGVDISDEIAEERSPWNSVTDRLIAWDTPPPPEYQRLKGELFTLVEDAWAPFFEDPDATIDWRWLSWGGVFIDDRPLGDPNPCEIPGCIPSLDDPELVPAAEGDWYDDDRVVFGVTEGDEAVAFPQNMMQVHEMVNITIGGRRFGIPYCTLCGSAQAFYTDQVPDGVETPVLRTSGLLSRSNKVMYDLNTFSAFDTFTGEAVSGPLLDAGVVLDQNTVTVSTWGEWKAAHPDTTIVAEDGGIGREYDDDPLRGRDDDGPIFPVGDVDPRLGVQDPVLGVVLDDGTPVAFDVAEARVALAAGQPVELNGVGLGRDGGGFVALVDGSEVAAHEAFWFAWSQFHPDTLLWPDDG
ncbi:MAG: DUF3179 domain-containing (seleno)protein [Ilumatobacter sp.]|uniref:DUF3179 domain-containing (seleno)protein n=1 Tax=Ilumatobacter sp. TaxID=1967498 RepID=UPI0026283341|nr:DUF3179 domain-containing (seleno)protein [Ilumatobacter sp.]MDJ0770930.1 DUF3179 domain-containing (seleno)protein [Ilumatobacter sp.]